MHTISRVLQKALFVLFHGSFSMLLLQTFSPLICCSRKSSGVANDMKDGCFLSAITAYRDTQSLMVMIMPVSSPTVCHERGALADMGGDLLENHSTFIIRIQH